MESGSGGGVCGVRKTACSSWKIKAGSDDWLISLRRLQMDMQHRRVNFYLEFTGSAGSRSKELSWLAH